MVGRSECLGGVGGGGHVAPRAGPVGVHELAGRRQQLVRVRPEVVALRLDQVGGKLLRPEQKYLSRRRSKFFLDELNLCYVVLVIISSLTLNTNWSRLTTL